MKLLNVSIQNYRSIEQLKLDFPFGCQALIGMNESGKTNILRALALIDPETTVSSEDIRIERRGESEIGEGSVKFQFIFDQNEIQGLVEPLFAKIHALSKDLVFVKYKAKDLTFAEFCKSRNLGQYKISLPNGNRSAHYYALSDDFEVVSGWAYNPTDSDYTLPNLSKDTAQNIEIIISAKGFARLEPSQVSSPLVELTAHIVNELIGKQILILLLENLPRCIFWKYSDQYLLPSTLDVNTFATNPDVCIPLRSMFELAGYKGTDIGASISKARASSPHRYFQLLRNVEDAATKHVRSVWSDNKSIKIELQPNGEQLHPLISDETIPLNMANRSDGFKRFVSFLLQISAKVKADEMQDVLLLIDEPEIGLNPGGARSLTQELIQVGITNTVVYSTHSIFMIDKLQIDRHIIVERKNEVTTAKRAEKSKIQDDQVLYAALGYSLFEVLKEKNIIFEGWKDKEIFRVLSDSIGKVDKLKKDALSTVGLTYAEGVKDVKYVSNFLELAARRCLIISDADQPALEKRKQYQKIGAWGKWVTLRDIFGEESTVQTGDDLLSKNSVIKKANKWRGAVSGLNALTVEDMVDRPVLTSLSKWLDSADLKGDIKDQKLSELKTALFENLKRDDLVEDAIKLIDFVLNYDFSLPE